MNDTIATIATIQQKDLKFIPIIQRLNDFYINWVKVNLTIAYIHEVRDFLGVKLQSKLGRAKVALEVAHRLYQEEHKASLPQTQTTKIIVTAIAGLLKPVPPTSGIENAPAWRLFGKPVYQHELRQGYLKLAKKYHPDVNPKYRKVFARITEIYAQMTENWESKYSPFINHTPEQLEACFRSDMGIDVDALWASV